MGQTCKIIAYRLFHSTVLAANGKKQYGVIRLDGLRWSRAETCKNNTKTPKTSLRSRGSRLISRIARHSNGHTRHGAYRSFISDYADYTDIFYHRSMEKDKLLILDVWGAYGQKIRPLGDEQARKTVGVG